MARVCDNCDGRNAVMSVDLMVVGDGNPAPLILDSNAEAARNAPGTTHPSPDYCTECCTLMLKQDWESLKARAHMGKAVAKLAGMTTSPQTLSAGPESPPPGPKVAKVPKPSGKPPTAIQEEPVQGPELLPSGEVSGIVLEMGGADCQARYSSASFS